MTKAGFCKKNRLAVLFLLFGIVLCAAYLWMCHVFGRTPAMRLRRCVFKFFINLCWLSIALIGSRDMQGEMKRKILLTLGCYMLGDVLAPANFLVGGVAFCAGHLIITSGYIRQYGVSRGQSKVFLAVCASMIALLAVSLGLDWRLPLFALYIIVLSAMDVTSFRNRYYFVTVNVFLLSDILAYFRKIFFNWDWFHDVTLLLYYVAILLYCFSFWFSVGEKGATASANRSH